MPYKSSAFHNKTLSECRYPGEVQQLQELFPSSDPLGNLPLTRSIQSSSFIFFLEIDSALREVNGDLNAAAVRLTQGRCTLTVFLYPRSILSPTFQPSHGTRRRQKNVVRRANIMAEAHVVIVGVERVGLPEGVAWRRWNLGFMSVQSPVHPLTFLLCTLLLVPRIQVPLVQRFL